ncbi:MAG: tetratricopeptide repeat protein, partial [Candidatus Heimdallarchaeota archaeon]
MLKKQSGILNEIDVLITRGNYNKALKSINKHITRDSKEIFFYLELLIRKSRIHFYKAEYSTSLTLATKSQKLSKKINNSLLIIDSLQIQGEVYSELGQREELYSVMKQIEEHLEIKQEEKGTADQKRKAEYYKLSGLYQIQKSELHKAIAEFQKSLDIFKQLDIQERIAEVSSKLGYLFFVKGDKEKASIIFDAIKTQEKLGNKEALSRSYIVLAENSLRSNELKQAFLHLETVFRLLENSENKYLLGQANNLRGLQYYEKGEFSLALKFLNKSLDFFKIIDNKRLIGSLISNMGLIHNLRGDLDLSLASFDQSLLIFEELGIQQNIAYHLGKLGSVYTRKGEHDLALVYFYKALEIMKELNVEVSIAKILSNIISVSICTNELENARQYLKQLQDVNEGSSNKKINIWTRISEALVLKSQNNDQDIERGFAILKQIAEEEIINIENYGDVFLNLCDILLKQLQTKDQEDYLKEIRKYLNQLYDMAHKQDSFWLVAQANWLLAYLAVIELDMIKAQHMFTQAQQMAEERGFKRLAMNISNEFDK